MTHWQLPASSAALACAATVLSVSAAMAQGLEAKKAALLDEMNKLDCKMTTPEADITMPRLGITRPEAIAIANEWLFAGQAKFGSDEETLIILPPLCKK